jgi:hypothetical protein
LAKKPDAAPAGDSPETQLALTNPLRVRTFPRMKKIIPLIVIVGLAGVVAQCIGLPELLKTGSCASGNTAFAIARPCPAGTGTTIALFGGGMTIAILAMVAGSLAGNGLFGGAGLFLWAAEFVGVGATVLVWALTHGNGPAGSKLASYIIALVFIPMGGIPLLFGLRSGLGGAEEKMVSRRSKRAEATISGVEELQRYGTNQARVRLTYAVSPADGQSFEVSRETNAIISHMPRRGDRATISYDPRHPDRFQVVSASANGGASAPSARASALPSSSSSPVSVPGVPGDTAQLPWSTVPVTVPAQVAAVSQRQPGGPDLLGKLKQLSDLHDSGALTDAEFQLEKSKILAQS